MNKLSRRTLAIYAADQLLLGVSAKKVAGSLAAGLMESGRGAEVEFLLGDIAAELEGRGELTVAKITTASPLPAELRAQLVTKVKKNTRTKGMLIDEVVDKTVIGGIRIETAGKVWDRTISRKLADLKEAF